MKLPNRYKLTGTTAGGGMGDILYCTDTHLGRPVVLKVLKDGEEERRLLDEQKALLKVRSKHVVQLFDVVQVSNAHDIRTALVLEHIDGSDLTIASFAPDTAYLKTIWQIACGLSEIHEAGVIHRDIKPNNVRIDNGGIVKILDFGLARSAGVDDKTNSIIGTKGYMAPELWGTSTVSFNQAVDVYAFGALALRLIEKNLPAHLLQEPPVALPKGKVGLILNGLPQDVIDVMEACLGYRAVDRPQIKEVEMVLRRHLLHNRHRALLVLDATKYEINASSPHVVAKVGSLGAVGIAYDGVRFTVSSLTGSVRVNNTTVAVGDRLPDCCVIAFGDNSARRFVTFDVSNPEVMP